MKTIFVPTGASFTSEVCAPLVATLPLEVFPFLDSFVSQYEQIGPLDTDNPGN